MSATRDEAQTPMPVAATDSAIMSRRIRWAVRAGGLLLRLLGWTWRIRLVNADRTVDAMRRAGKPFIFALWHGDMLPLLYHHRNEGVAVLISEHRDGEVIAQTALGLGFRTVRGSTTRGAGRALIGLVKELTAGHEVAITPDGPRGPARSFAPGALIAGHRARASVVACGLATPRAWRLKSWDAFRIPKPFSRVTIAYAGPAMPEGSSPRAAAEETAHFQALMAEAERLANG